MGNKLHRRLGRPPKRKVKDRLLKIFTGQPVNTTHRLKEIYRKRFKESISWNTVKKYVEILREEGEVVKQVEIPQSNGDQVVVYRRVDKPKS